MKISPCLNCADRKVGCHIDCVRYKEYREIIDNEHEKAMSAREKRDIVIPYVTDMARTIKRRRGR